MFLRIAHLCVLVPLTAAPAGACGELGGAATIAAVDPGGDFTLADGRRARLGGLALAPAAAFALKALADRTLGLALLSPRPDRWGRLIVDLADGPTASVALDFVVRGLARVKPEPESRVCESERLEAEAAARAAGEGVWSDPHAVLDAGDRAALVAADGRFVLVEGIVRRVGEGRAKVYLDFVGRGGFSVVIARKDLAAFGRRGIIPKALSGRKVLVRGVLDDRFSPRIEVADPSLIETGEGAKETNRGG